jgi:drug/metabolite transporter (DMT)-like permease
MQPDFLFHNTAIAIPNYQVLSLMVIVGAVCFSITMIYIHDIGKKLSSIVNLHYSYIGHMFLTAVIGNFDNPVVDFSEIDPTFVLAFCGLVLSALLTQYMIFAATALKKPSKTMPFGYVAIVTTFTADVWLFGITFDFLQIIGMVLTSVGLLSKFLIGDEPRPKSEHPLQSPESEEEEEDRISREGQRQKL